MADLSQLMQQSPFTGGFMFGEQENQNSLMQSLLRAKEQQSIDHSAVMNPLLQQHQRGINDTQEAQLPGVRANSRLLGTQADEAAALSPSKISSGIATNKSVEGKAMTEDFERQRRVLKEASMMASSAKSPMEAASIMTEVMRKNGVDPSKDQSAGAMIQLATSNPEAFAKIMDEIDQRAAKNTAAYLAPTDAARIKGVTDRYEADQRLAGVKYAADRAYDRSALSTNARANPTEEQLFAKQRGADKLRFAQDMASKYSMKGDDEAAYMWAQRAQQLRVIESSLPQNNPKPGSVDVEGTTNGDVKTNKPTPVQTAPLPKPRNAASAPIADPATQDHTANPVQEMTVGAFRKKYPMYSNYSDEALRAALKQKGIELK